MPHWVACSAAASLVQMSLDRVDLALRFLSNTMRFISTGNTGFDSRLEFFIAAQGTAEWARGRPGHWQSAQGYWG